MINPVKFLELCEEDAYLALRDASHEDRAALKLALKDDGSVWSAFMKASRAVEVMGVTAPHPWIAERDSLRFHFDHQREHRAKTGGL